jgi:hypothetical protein
VNSGERRSQTIERKIARRLTLSEEEAFLSGSASPSLPGRRAESGNRQTPSLSSARPVVLSSQAHERVH